MSTDLGQQASLDAAADMAIASESTTTDTTTTERKPAAGEAAAAPPAGGDTAATLGTPPPAPKPYEAPTWAKRWKDQTRKAHEALYGMEGARPHVDVLNAELEQTYGYVGQRDQQYADWRRQTQPLLEVVAPYAERYRLQGMTVEQGVSQLLQVSDYLSRDPDNAFGWLAGQIKPRDAAATLRGLAQAWGVADLSALQEGGEWVDPAYSGLVNPLRQQISDLQRELAEFRGGHEAQQREQYEQHRTALSQHLDALGQSKGDDGALRYPHFDRVEPMMIHGLQSGFVKRSGDIQRDFDAAYKFAVHNDEQLQTEVAQARADEARRNALGQAASTTKDTEQALSASRNVAGSASGKQAHKRMTLDEAADAAEADAQR